MPFLKRSAVCLLVVVFSLSVFQYSIFRYAVKSLKSEFRLNVLRNSAALESLEISTDQLYRDSPDLEWKDSNKELCLGGNYYDIVRIERGQLTSLVFLIEDVKESRLFTDYFSSQTESTSFLCSFLKTLDCPGPGAVQVFCSLSGTPAAFIPYNHLEVPQGVRASLIKPPARGQAAIASLII